MELMQNPSTPFSSIDDVERQFARHRYITDRMLATTVFLSTTVGKPLFLEGEPGVGKTEVAKALAASLDAELIRLQCYEGLDAQSALYEWNYPRQMLELRLQEARGIDREQIGANLFSEDFLLRRPLLQALSAPAGRRNVLLIDEVDRADEAFEAFLLEILSDFQITIPELGTIRAEQKPLVVLTSNRSRELHDALKRRCLYHWVEFPDFQRELRILESRVPGIGDELATQICRFMQWIRTQDLFKRPGIAEMIDWAEALTALGADDVDTEVLQTTLGCILKYQRDLQSVQQQDLAVVVDEVKGASARA
ncbi:AAA family ATPase [Elongatibacter sediminis]